ncbi:hypothetical protein QBC46DRAFT_357015 [Diplogelasinospora grovesii]|uniref:Uncharacterized protein n=1 Tax=Diplogelasinospora grovesii TaxID=303347 RepID=A0AAN6N0M3_9PEZI|nr:hypothetical protein QBC46DRAFT_357015 [Diplogelasinospora grovesii]
MSWSGFKHQSAHTQQPNQEDDLTPDKLILDENGEAYADLIAHDANVAVTFNDATARRIAGFPHAYEDALVRIVRRVAAEGGWTHAEITSDIKSTSTQGSHRPSNRSGRPNVIRTGRQTTVVPDAPHITVRLTSNRFWSADTTVHINTSVNDLNLYKKLYEKEKKKAEKKAKKQLQKSGNNFDSDDEAGGAGAAGMGGSSGNPPGGSGSGASGGAGQGRGAASGKSRATNPFDVLGEEGPTDSQGHAAYYGDVMVKGKASTTLVSVVPAGMSDGKGGLFFCWHFGDKQHSCFATPPAVSKKDPRQARAARLYDLAVELYKGKVAPLVPQNQYELPIRGAASDSNYTYARPDSRDGAGGYGAYPARPDSRGGADGYGAYPARPDSRDGAGGYGAYPARPDSRGGADGYGAYAPRPDSRGNPVAGNPTPPPASKPAPKPAPPPASKPSGSSSKPAPAPPRNVQPEKSRDKYTVHGIDKGRPYIKGIDKKDPGRHVDVQYSQKEKQYYVKPGSERIWLKEVR